MAITPYMPLARNFHQCSEPISDPPDIDSIFLVSSSANSVDEDSRVEDPHSSFQFNISFIQKDPSQRHLLLSPLFSAFGSWVWWFCRLPQEKDRGSYLYSIGNSLLFLSLSFFFFGVKGKGIRRPQLFGTPRL